MRECWEMRKGQDFLVRVLFARGAMDFKFLWKRGDGLGRVCVWNREEEAVTQHRDTSSDPLAFSFTEEKLVVFLLSL